MGTGNSSQRSRSSWSTYIALVAASYGFPAVSAVAQVPNSQLPYGRDPSTWAPPETWNGPDANWSFFPIPNSRMMPMRDEILQRQFPNVGLILTFEPGKFPRVAEIQNGSTSELNGLQINDSILLVNDFSATDHFEQLNSENPQGTSIRYWRAGQLGLVTLPPIAPEFCYYSVAKIALLKTNVGLKVVSSSGTSFLRTGDIIKSVAGQPIESIRQFNQQMQKLNGPTQIVFNRAGSANDSSGTLLPTNFRNTLGTTLLKAADLGLSAENYFEFLRIQVEPMSQASEMGLSTGDRVTHINGKAIRDLQNMTFELSNLQTATIQRQGTTVQIGPRGTASRMPTFDFQIRNFTDRSLNLFRRRQGARSSLEEYVKSIAPQQSITVKTYEGQSWAARESKTGVTVKEFATRGVEPQLTVAPESDVLNLETLGLTGQLVPQIGFLVLDVDESGDASRLGIKTGDVIQSIDNEPTSHYLSSGSPLDTQSIFELLPNGYQPSVEVRISPIEQPDPIELENIAMPDWVIQSNRPSLGGIQVIRSEPGQTPPVTAALAAYYISQQEGQFLKILDVLYHGTQVVAGTNYFFVCRMEDPQTHEVSVWNVEFQIDPEDRSQLSEIERLR